MHPREIEIAAFTYDLPADRIARYPLPKRDASKLLVFNKGNIGESTYAQLDTFLPQGALLIFNNTKVIEARLLFQKESGGMIEIFCLEPGEQYADITTAMAQQGKVYWKCLIGGASKWKHGLKLKKQLIIEGTPVVLEAAISERLSDSFIVELSWDPAPYSFSEVLHAAGYIPLPPYLQRQAEEADKERYQTIYAAHDGSVAAPTAGLHFTEAVFSKLEAKHIRPCYVTLHVGAGTFKPVKTDRLEAHEMHAEFIDVSLESILEMALFAGKTIVAVGTTSLRTIESLYWIGRKILSNPTVHPDEVEISQWEPYDATGEVSPEVALTALATWMRDRQLARLVTRTQILIAPPYKLKVAKAIITNFHQPQSTLLLLIAAVVGNKWKDIYNYALQHDFRFLSYGDGSLLWKQEQ